jgi:hypothetical protein
MGSNPINLAVRFLLEIAGLIAIGYWGWHQGEGFLSIILAIGLPVIAAVLWGTFAVLEDPSRSCHFTPYTVPVSNSQDVPPVYGQSVPPINGQDVPLSTSLHPPTILPAKYEKKPEGTWQEKGKRSWTFMHSCNIYEPGTVADVSTGT